MSSKPKNAGANISNLPTNGNDEFTAIQEELFSATFEGGDGIDTLILIGPGMDQGWFNLDFTTFNSIEILRATSDSNFIAFQRGQLDGFLTIDGGEGHDEIALRGDGYDLHYDLRGKTFLNVESIGLYGEEGTSVSISDKVTALKLKGYSSANDVLTFEGGVLSEAERRQLHDQGIDVIIVGDETYTDQAPVIENLTGSIRIAAGEKVLLDIGNDAVVSDESSSLKTLEVNFSPSVGWDETDDLSIDESGNVQLSSGMAAGSEVSVDGTVIGQIIRSIGFGFLIRLNDNAAPELVQEVVQALRYGNSSTDPDLATYREIVITLEDIGSRTTQISVPVYVAPPNKIILTKDMDDAQGTATSDVFIAVTGTIDFGDSINGGGGDDVLELAGSSTNLTYLDQFESIETVRGVNALSSQIIINASILDKVHALDGGAGTEERDSLTLAAGQQYDLSEKNISNFEVIQVISSAKQGTTVIVADKAMAQLIEGYAGSNDHLVLKGAAFTETERKELWKKGVDKITDASGVYSNAPPQIQGLDDAIVRVSAGHVVFLDTDRNVSVTDDFTLAQLHVQLFQDPNFGTDYLLGIDQSGIVKVQNQAVLVDGVDIGSITDVRKFKIEIAFNQNATPARVQELLRVLTYTNTGPAGTPVPPATVEINLFDEGRRHAGAMVSIQDDVSERPTAINLSSNIVQEHSSDGAEIGQLSTIDVNLDEKFEYSLLDDAGGRFAIDGNRLVVKDGIKLDYEQNKTHQITVQIQDKHGLTFDRMFIIDVSDKAPEVTSGSADDDMIVGGQSDDRLGGAAGRDTINGGYGNDCLDGGPGRDIFVFDTRLSPSQNLDRIANFSVQDDTIWLDNAIFTKLGKSGSIILPVQLKKEFFAIDQAKDENDYIIYKWTTGKLLYDPDGAGFSRAIEFAQVAENLEITEKDFYII
jgi:Ca2+-binding RTX toxin-like protein